MSCIPCQQAKNVLKKASNIVEGYTNLIIKDSEVETLAATRKQICLACEFKKPLVKVNNIQYYSCSICSCPVDSATRSTGYSCPKGKW